MDECCGYIVIDSHSGDSICSGCGIVRNNALNDLPKVQLQRDHRTYSTDEFANLCDKKHIAPCIIELASEMNACNSEQENKAELAFCLYAACQKFNAGRSIKEIADILHLDSKSKQQFSMKCKQDQIRPSHLNQRVCSQLGITDYKTISNIGKEADLIYDKVLLSHSPQSILAGTIIKTLENKQPNISPKAIAQACQVSLACAKRVCKKLVE